jgi:hypothetical protein
VFSGAERFQEQSVFKNAPLANLLLLKTLVTCKNIRLIIGLTLSAIVKHRRNQASQLLYYAI